MQVILSLNVLKTLYDLGKKDVFSLALFYKKGDP
jgi:hypothetical protein